MHSAADAAPSFLYLPELAAAPGAFPLDAENARYVARVVRAKPGEHVRASDGAGLVARLLVEAVRPDVVVRVLERERTPEPPARILLCGAPEGERGDWLVEKCAELGVTRFVPVHAARATWPGGAREERWRRLAVAALRQSQAARLMEVAPPMPIEAAAAELPPGARWLAEPGAVSGAEVPFEGRDPIVGALGPAPGFEPEEKHLLTQIGFLPISLAAHRLRTETAAVALAALWAARSVNSAAHLDAPGSRP